MVVAVDVADQLVSADPDAPGEVRLSAAVPLKKAAAVHVDADDAEQDVAAAAAALGAADQGGTTTRSSRWTAPTTTS
ncbi:hypothetical protein GCM10020000_49750 [Streptomyces olivoverticillatus]